MPSTNFKKFNLDYFKNHNPSQTNAILIVVLFILLTGNHSLFGGILNIYPLNLRNLPFLISLSLFFTSLTAIFFLVISHGKWTRWILAIFLIIAAQAAYYMDSFGVIIDNVMIDNIMQTDKNEVAGLLNSSMFLRTLLFGVMPAWLIIKYCPKPSTLAKELKSRLYAITFFVITILVIVIPFTADYASFIREHKIVRFYSNPTYAVYSAIKYVSQQTSIKAHKSILYKTAEDAVLQESPNSKKQIMIMVVGETARADRFSLNGYKRETNPALSKHNIVSFSNVSSCGTSTGVSVPCMFSSLDRKKYDKEKALQQENVLDVLSRQGVEVLWRDNNSDSKGVATRIRYEDYRSPTLNPVCDDECRDIGMLNGLDQYIEKNKDKDMMIVLHQMGNHGPEYYRRYPKEFERFKPACQTGELRDCSKEEIDNAYDNAILYTDYFLSEVINFLKKYDEDFEVTMLYVSDHGESLGEHNIYLHAAPYLIAPKVQTHVPVIAWTGNSIDYDIEDIKPNKDFNLSHDDMFCTLLVAYDLESKMCEDKNAILVKNKNLKLDKMALNPSKTKVD